MKSFVIISIILAISFYEASSLHVRAGMYKDPNNPGMCTIHSNMIVQPGEYKNHNGECSSLTCYSNGHVEVRGCMHQGMRPGCVEGHVLNPSAPYPECCKRAIKCKTDYYSK